MSDDNYAVKVKEPSIESDKKPAARILQTTVSSNTSPRQTCPIHQSASHSILDCKAFSQLQYSERRIIAINNVLCFRCLGTHRAADCASNFKCDVCHRQHHTLMHRPTTDPTPRSTSNITPENTPHLSNNAPGNIYRDTSSKQHTLGAHVMYTQLNDQGDNAKNCSKTLLVELTMKSAPDKRLVAYCIIDEQATTSLVDDRVPAFFNQSFPLQEYSLSFARPDCTLAATGQVVTGLMVRGINASEVINIPEALSTPSLSDTRHEAATPQIAKLHPHTAHLAHLFPPRHPEAEVLLLIGRNCGRAMSTESLTPGCEPYVHKTPLGYALVGHTCIKEQLPTPAFTVLATRVDTRNSNSVSVKYRFPSKLPDGSLADSFARNAEDDLQGLSRDDRTFLSLMAENVRTTPEGHIELPLPIRDQNLPDNKIAVFHRSKNTLNKLKSQDSKLKSCLEAMRKNIEAGFVEKVPPTQLDPPSGRSWYLPIFCVDQPKKSKVRLVYDASAKYNGTSLNDALYQGPDLTNHLRGVLLRFREHPIAFGADIEAMFSNFKVPAEQRDLLRFFWFDQNDCNKPIVQYRSTSHIFGCTSSPAVANFGLKHCASQPFPKDYDLARRYINESFYVDDGLRSVTSPECAIQVLTKAREMLFRHNIRLHKIVSNSPEVVNHFPATERAGEPLHLEMQPTSVQRTLGVAWSTLNDAFMINVTIPQRSFTKRGIISVVNTIYDPLGLVSPVTLMGRLIQRDVLPPKDSVNLLQNFGWDDLLPDQYKVGWDRWIESLRLLKLIQVPRNFYPLNFRPQKQELHVYCDASDKAIGYVMYLRSLSDEGDTHVAFVSSASRVAPRCATSIPRLELCAALEAAKGATSTVTELERKPDNVLMHSDSKIVLGYLANKQRRFSKYVERRVSIILDHTLQSNWHYISSKENPADYASRPTYPDTLTSTPWFNGPATLWNPSYCPDKLPQEEVSLPEETKTASILLTAITQETSPLASVWNRTNKLNTLINITRNVTKFKHHIDLVRQKRGITLAPRPAKISRNDALKILIKEAQKGPYGTILALLENRKRLPENCKTTELTPRLDSDGILRVGGRLKNANLPFCVKHPALLPREHPLSTIIASHFHEESKHQGGHITHGTLIQAGFHIEHGRQLIRKMIRDCVTCRKLRAEPMTQIMSDLPSDRIENFVQYSTSPI
ncbi:uncharacterized protein LOC108675002 [Hyalella azteca]|uniref:Uncharacterized protein LOC108675002 n=1 Tax=Hyalella azteca TaxID=294128 RepID=A0A8B7P063_HYAAZ|nr:uncharacterized protein LOC108675002 [Hyalella azteca]